MDFTVNDKEAQSFLKKKLKQVKSIQAGEDSYVKLLSPVVFSDIISHFEKESGPEGPWKPWSKMYNEHMQAIGKGGNKILQDTGNLRQAFQPTNVKSSGRGILWFNPAKTQSGFPYAAAHDTGGPRLPKRSFMWLSAEARQNISKQTLKFLESEAE